MGTIRLFQIWNNLSFLSIQVTENKGIGLGIKSA